MTITSSTRRPEAPRLPTRGYPLGAKKGGVHTAVTGPEHSFVRVGDMRTATTVRTSAGTTSPRSSRGADVQGERFVTPERLVLAPTAGVFEPAMDLRAGCEISAGQVVGHLRSGSTSTPVVSPFAGRSGAALAWAGERMTSHQPVMWLSTAVGPS